MWEYSALLGTTKQFSKMVIPVCIPNKTYENLNSFFFFLARFVMDDNPGDKYLLEQTDANAHESF